MQQDLSSYSSTDIVEDCKVAETVDMSAPIELDVSLLSQIAGGLKLQDSSGRGPNSGW